MIKNFGSKMEKMQESINKDLEESKNKHIETNSTITEIKNILEGINRASLVAQMLKRLPTMWETWVQSLGREDLLEKEMAPHSSILAWKIPWMGNLVGYSRWGHKELDMTERIHFTSLQKESIAEYLNQNKLLSWKMKWWK